MTYIEKKRYYYIIINMNIEDYNRYYLLFIRYSILAIPYWLFPIGYSLLGIPYCLLIAYCREGYGSRTKDQDTRSCWATACRTCRSLGLGPWCLAHIHHGWTYVHQEQIIAPKRLYKAPTDYTKTPKYYTKTKNIKHELKIFHKSSNKYQFHI